MEAGLPSGGRIKFSGGMARNFRERSRCGIA